jgi:hypothetical protein
MTKSWALTPASLDADHGARTNDRQEAEVEKPHTVFGVILHSLPPDPGANGGSACAAPRESRRRRSTAQCADNPVPRKRGDALAGLRSHRGQRVGHAARAGRKVLVGVAVDVAFDTPRHDLLLPVLPLGSARQAPSSKDRRGNRLRPIARLGAPADVGDPGQGRPARPPCRSPASAQRGAGARSTRA